MVFYLSEGQRNEMVGYWSLMESGQVDRGQVVADRGCTRGASALRRATPRECSGAI